MSDKKFIDGLRIFKPHEKAPDFVIADGVINWKELFEWATDQGEETRIQIKQSKKGNFYAEINDYTPEKKENPLEQFNPEKKEANPTQSKDETNREKPAPPHIF